MEPPHDESGTSSAPVPPTGPRGRRLFGSLGEYNADPLGFLTDLSRQYGDVVPMRLGPLNAVLLSDPGAIESVLVTQNRAFRKARGVRRLRSLLGNGIFISEGEPWLHQRRLMQPAFHRASVGRYADTMVRRTSLTLDRWRPDQTVDISSELRRLTLEIAGESLFGADISEDEVRLVGESLEVAGTQLQTRVSSLLMFVPDWVPTPGNRRMNAAIARLDGLVYRIIEGRRRAPDQREDLLAMLLAAAHEDGTRLSDRQLRDEVITLLVAGHETTSLTLTWAAYLLARHPQPDATLQQELASVLHGRPPKLEDLPRLRFTEHVISETLRLYPASYITARESVRDVEIEGHPIRKGTLVLISQWARHRDPRVFDDPDRFLPERWADGLEKRLRRGDYFPFGMGPRQCIGASFAMLESVLVLAAVRQRFRFEPATDDDAHPVPVLTLQPDRPILLAVRAIT
jgi:cytochrome P450